jgi:Lon protease-like protein
VNFHIFEPRYRQLIGECLATDSTFGIPSYLNNRMPGLGTEIKLEKLVQQYDDGKMDIKTVGLSVFKVLTFENPVRDKLYSGGRVQTLDNNLSDDAPQAGLLRKEIERIEKLLEVSIPIANHLPLSYQIGHKIGLSPEQEYELLGILSERERQAYLLDHLNKAIPVIEQMEKAKKIIRMNGHFRYLDPLNLES